MTTTRQTSLVEPEEMRRRVDGARIAHLATSGADGRPHVVAISFALAGDIVYFAVDAKPKRSRDLKRVRNITTNPSVSLLVDHYEEDWTKLWWVRLDGSARVLEAGDEFERAIGLLVERYAQYRSAPPAGPVVGISIERMTGWSAS